MARGNIATDTRTDAKNLAEGLFGRSVKTVVKSLKELSAVKITTLTNDGLVKYAQDLGYSLDQYIRGFKEQRHVDPKIRETPYFEKVSEFFLEISPKFDGEPKIYVQEEMEATYFVQALFQFSGKTKYVQVEQKEPDSKALRADEIQELVETYEEYLAQGKNKEEAEALVARFLEGKNKNQAGKIISEWQKKVTEVASKMKVAPMVAEEVLVAQERFTDIETGVLERVVAKSLSFSEKHYGAVVNTEQFESVLAEVKAETGSVMPADKFEILHELVAEVQAKNEVWIKTNRLVELVFEGQNLAPGIKKQVGGEIFSLVASPIKDEVEIKTSVEKMLLKNPVGVEVGLAKTIAQTAGALRQELASNNPTLLAVAMSSEVHKQQERVLGFVKNSIESLTAKEQEKVQNGVKIIGKVTGGVTNPVSLAMAIEAIALGKSSGEIATIMATGAIPLIFDKSLEFERVAGELNNLGVETRRIPFFNKIDAFTGAINKSPEVKKAAVDIKNKLLKNPTLAAIYDSSVLGKIRRTRAFLSNPVGSLANLAFEKLGGQKLVMDVAGKIGTRFGIKEASAGLMALANKVGIEQIGVSTFSRQGAAVVLTKVGTNLAAKGAFGKVVGSALLKISSVLGLALPGPGWVWTVVSLVTPFFVDKVGGYLKKILSKGPVEGALTMAGDFAKNMVRNTIIGASAFVGLLTSALIFSPFLLPLKVAGIVVLVWIFGGQLATGGLVSSLVAPKPVPKIFSPFNPADFPEGKLPDGCVEGAPVPLGLGSRIVQGPKGSFSHAKNSLDAIDITNVIGTPILATHGGEVLKADCSNSGNYGCQVILKGVCTDINNKTITYQTLYGHFHEMPNVGVGSTVVKRQKLGIMGSTGYSRGPHLHYELRMGVSLIQAVSSFIQNAQKLMFCTGFVQCGSIIL